MEGNIGYKFPAVLRLQDKVQFHVQFPTHVLKIPGHLWKIVHDIIIYYRKFDNYLQKVRKSAVYLVPGVIDNFFY